MKHRMAYVYMLRCKDDSLYTGIAKDLGHRIDVYKRQVLYRTEAFCVGESSAIEQLSLSELYGEPYGRIYQAIESTSGMAVTIDGEYRELPFHKLSVGHTRDGKLLGDSYDYVLSVECREDKEASDYVQICTLSMDCLLYTSRCV